MPSGSLKCSIAPKGVGITPELSTPRSSNDAAQASIASPEATEKPMYGTPAFYVKARFFARLNNDGRTAVIHVADLDEKEALLTAEPVKLTTTPHYDGHASVLVVLAKVTKAELREFLTDSWRLRAPKRLIAECDSQQH